MEPQLSTTGRHEQKIQPSSSPNVDSYLTAWQSDNFPFSITPHATPMIQLLYSMLKNPHDARFGEFCGFVTDSLNSLPPAVLDKANESGFLDPQKPNLKVVWIKPDKDDQPHAFLIVRLAEFINRLKEVLQVAAKSEHLEKGEQVVSDTLLRSLDKIPLLNTNDTDILIVMEYPRVSNDQESIGSCPPCYMKLLLFATVVAALTVNEQEENSLENALKVLGASNQDQYQQAGSESVNPISVLGKVWDKLGSNLFTLATPRGTIDLASYFAYLTITSERGKAPTVYTSHGSSNMAFAWSPVAES